MSLSRGRSGSATDRLPSVDRWTLYGLWPTLQVPDQRFEVDDARERHRSGTHERPVATPSRRHEVVRHHHVTPVGTNHIAVRKADLADPAPSRRTRIVQHRDPAHLGIGSRDAQSVTGAFTDVRKLMEGA